MEVSCLEDTKISFAIGREVTEFISRTKRVTNSTFEDASFEIPAHERVPVVFFQ